ncbi:MAG: glycosyltransferase family 39 protein [Candidatus Omnitrophota bacterium]|nr:glycosyltransferase family 39 protein [Candidatus Omnitrophota bacterium]
MNNSMEAASSSSVRHQWVSVWAVRLVVLAGLILFWIVSNASLMQKSNTFDEEYDIARGITPWKTGNYTIYDYHPPFAHMISTIPLLWTKGFFYPEDYKNFSPQLLSYLLLYKNQISMESILFPCRRVTVIVALILAIAVFSWAKRLYGAWPAVVSFLLCILSPNIMANGQLVTNDLMTALLYFLSVFTLWMWLQDKKNKFYLLMLGVLVGCAQISKFSSLILYPAVGLIMVGDAFLDQPSETNLWKRLWQATQKTFLAYGVVLCMSLLIIYVGYGLTFDNYINNFRKNTLDLILKVQRNYMFGEIYHGKIWYFPLVAIFLKMPLATMFLFLSGVFLAVRSGKKFSEYATVYGGMIAFMLIASIPQKNQQLRYFLPFFPFAFLIAGNAVSRLRGKFAVTVIMGLLVWLAAENRAIYPDYLTYMNSLVGGAKNGHKYLLDSNYDWGQDMKALKKYMDENKIEKVSLAYFGRSDPEYYGIDFGVLPSGGHSVLRLHSEKRVELPPKGWVVISANLLQGYYLPEGYNDLYDNLQEVEPVDRIGNTLFVYYLV